MSGRDWMTVKKAEEVTGLPSTFFDERTGSSGVWPEGTVWKWWQGRKLVNLEAVYDLIDSSTSIHSNRGRRRAKAANEPAHAEEA